MHPLNRLYSRIILASASPRRADLLRQIGVDFETFPSCIDESPAPELTPAQIVRWASSAKAHAIASQVDRGLIIGADTLVVYQGQPLGKPRDLDEARHMLQRLSGHVHEVLTGVTTLHLETRREACWTTCTRVTFRELESSEIEHYVRSESVLDKAGAYGIQGGAAAFVTRIDGCYFNVVGLPLADLVERLLTWAR